MLFEAQVLIENWRKDYTLEAFAVQFFLLLIGSRLAMRPDELDVPSFQRIHQPDLVQRH